MLTNRESSIDYSQPDAWDRLGLLLERTFEPRPSANCGRVECEPGWTWRPRLSDYDLWFVVEGRGHVRLGESSYAVQSGTLLFLRPGDGVLATQDPEDRLTVIFVHLDFFVPGQTERVRMDGGWLPTRYVPFQDAAQLDMLLTRVVHLMEQNQRFSVIEAQLLVSQSLLEIYKQDALQHGNAPVQRNPRLVPVLSYLRSHPSARLSLEQAARMARLSPGYFSRLFKRDVGESFRSYVLQTRLERSRHLLEETDMPVGEIALALGYDDVFLLSRQFKQRYGYPPSYLRKQ